MAVSRYNMTSEIDKIREALDEIEKLPEILATKVKKVMDTDDVLTESGR